MNTVVLYNDEKRLYYAYTYRSIDKAGFRAYFRSYLEAFEFVRSEALDNPIVLPKIITEQYLKNHPNQVFVFGDNIERRGTGGAAKLRHLSNTYGFITKKAPDYNNSSFYTPDEYEGIFSYELVKLKEVLLNNPTKTYLISKIGAGLANRYSIFEQVIEKEIKRQLDQFENVIFLW